MDCSNQGKGGSGQGLGRLLNFWIISILFMTNIFAETDWRKYGWQIYDNAGDARSIAIGNTSVADDHSISALWNPAINTSKIYRNFTYSHQSRFAGIIQSDLISFPFSIKNNRNFNLVLLHESVSKIPNTQNILLDWGLDGVPNTGDFGESNGYLDDGERLDNENVSYFNQHQLGVYLSTQFSLYGQNIGVAIKSLFHKLGENYGSGIGLDIGMTKQLRKNTNFGISIQNLIPGMLVWDSGTIELSKSSILLGGSQTVNVSKIPLKIMILSDFIFNIGDQSLSDDFHVGSTGVNWRFGSEIVYNNKVNVRFGRSKYGFYSAGLGIAWTNFEINYAYQLNSKSVELGTNHVLSFTLNPKWIKNKLKYEKEEL